MKTRKKYMKTLLTILVVLFSFSGCGAKETFVGNKTSSNDSFTMDYSILNCQEDASLKLEAGDTLRVIIAHEAAGSVAFSKIPANAANAAYQSALQQIAFEHVYPDGTDTRFDGASGFIEDNHFALCDVNGDGKDELIVQFVTAPMAGNVETVYSYDEARETLHKILAVFPAMTYYTNGLVKEDWSHGSELAGDEYWPYNLYQYSSETGEYELIAEVNMWSKSADTIDYKGDIYPADIDAENAGTVFILTQDGITKTISKSDYEAWLSDMMGDAIEMQIPYLSLSEDNIKAED